MCDSLLAAAVEGHTHGPQKADRHGDGCDGQHLSLVHLFALCGEPKERQALILEYLILPVGVSDCVQGPQEGHERTAFIPTSVCIRLYKSH